MAYQIGQPRASLLVARKPLALTAKLGARTVFYTFEGYDEVVLVMHAACRTRSVSFTA